MDTQENYKQHTVKKKVKRFRSTFTTEQVNYLEKQYKKCPYITNHQRKEIATELNISERAIKVWYQNRRMKEKREGGGQNFENEQIKHADYTKYNKWQLNNMMKSPNYEPRILTNGKTSDKNVTTNHSTSTVAEQMNKSIESAYVTTPVPENIVATTKADNLVTDVLLKEPKTKQINQMDVSNKKHTKKNSTTVNNEQPNQKELEEPKKNLPINTTQQIKPEDLTLNQKTNEPVAVPEAASNDPGITTVPTVLPFNPQSYAPMFWNQTGVPIMPIDPSISASSSSLVNDASSSQDNVVIKRCWHCDPNIRQLMMQMPYTFPQQDPNFQYIITAVPIQTPSPKSS
ncbi:homeobox protein HOX3-like [Spodoptera frugiperda]|uniref:Homeobox protein HOX3-like n=1 Tax=Spodoptera frugiperda TaxID=7108 RepID=A0A9R0D6D5_SPOFR|nr:homeobox protein HOX3-like [Spodoptera frugiperda]